MEHFSQYRSSLKTVNYFVMSNSALSDEKKAEFSNVLDEVSDSVMNTLRDNNHETNDLDAILHRVYNFIGENDPLFSKGLREKVYRFMNDFHESVENLYAIHTHRTPISLKAYCLIFIYIFPVIYAPVIIQNIGGFTPPWVAYAIVLLTQYILISLYNIQDKLEYPFDDDGLDDIKLENFRFYR